MAALVWEKRAQVAIEQQSVEPISPGTIRTWLRQDKIKPWRYHAWQHATDPQCVDKAVPVLDLYQYAQELAAQGEKWWSAVTRRPRSGLANASVRRMPLRPGSPSTSRIGIKGWARGNSSVPSWSPRG